jgi:hypothetical protein
MINKTELLKTRLAMGLKNEKKYITFINKHYNKQFLKLDNGYSAMDFISDDGYIFIELKTRTNKYDKYNTTVVGENKILYGLKKIKNNNVRVIFLFGFTDGLYCWELTNDTYIKIGGSASFKLGECSAEHSQYKKHAHIPISNLSLIDKSIVPYIDKRYIELYNQNKIIEHHRPLININGEIIKK